jgi:hypothetical protein
MSDTERRFSQDYAGARDRFRAAPAARRGAMEVLDGLTIDWAWQGDPDARRVIVYTSGLHGVEGFGGSAAQLETMHAEDAGSALYVHALNPFGMASIRRVNENNVDLNRNCLADGTPYEGADPAYTRLDPLLNPPSPPPAFELFWPKVGWALLSAGYQSLKNAVVSGQYAFPKGLFYGGAGLERGPELVLDFLASELAGRDAVVHVDWHSGLGAYGGRTVLLEGRATPETLARVRAAFGQEVRSWDASNPDAYVIRGALVDAVARRLPGVRYDALTCELGTLPNLRVLAALRDENRLHHWGEAKADSPAKRALREAFAPTARAWQERVLGHAAAVHRACGALLAG